MAHVQAPQSKCSSDEAIAGPRARVLQRRVMRCSGRICMVKCARSQSRPVCCDERGRALLALHLPRFAEIGALPALWRLFPWDRACLAIRSSQ